MSPAVVAVTGADGNVGRAVVRRLRDAGHVVRPFGRPAFDLRSVSVEDLRGLEVDAVVHLAARVPVGAAASAAAGVETMAIDQRVFDATSALGLRVVYASTCGLYAPGPDWKQETSPVRARPGYFEAKAHGEQLFSTLPSTAVLRLPSPVGCPTTRTVLRTFVDASLAGAPLDVWGSGSREQDFVAVDDVADAVERVIALGAAGTYNIASGQPTTMLELAATVVSVTGQGWVRPGLQADPDDAATARYDTSRARDDLGWTAQRGLPEIIERFARSLSALRATS